MKPKIKQLKDLFTTITVTATGEERIVLRDDPKEIKDFLLGIMFEYDKENSIHSFDLLYNIAQSSIHNLPDEDDLNSIDPYELYEFASIYTRDRLDYITIYNQDEISDIVKEQQTDIETACAYWFDSQCQLFLSSVLESIKE